jgi:hypothetical protein
MLKTVVRVAMAREAPCWGEEVMGCWRYWHIRARSWSWIEDWVEREIRRLYAAVNSARRVSWWRGVWRGGTDLVRGRC